jgi:hypothetical protein
MLKTCVLGVPEPIGHALKCVSRSGSTESERVCGTGGGCLSLTCGHGTQMKCQHVFKEL